MPLKKQKNLNLLETLLLVVVEVVVAVVGVVVVVVIIVVGVVVLGLGSLDLLGKVHLENLSTAWLAAEAPPVGAHCIHPLFTWLLCLLKEPSHLMSGGLVLAAPVESV